MVRIERHDTAVDVEGEREVVYIDASLHLLLVDTPSFGVVELGSSRAGVAAATGLALDEVGAPADEANELMLSHALLSALQTAARRAEHGCPVDRFRAHGLRWTPLAYSASFLAQRWLIDDVERFLPCRVALAHAEPDDDDGSLAQAEARTAPLVEWRKLYAADGAPTKPLTTTLAEFGDDVTPFALWGLRQVRLTRRAQSTQHVEVLGTLGRHPDAARLRWHMELVERASVDELADAVGRVPRVALGLPADVDGAHRLAELLALVDEHAAGGARTLRTLLARALVILDEHLPMQRNTALPPIALPNVPGVRFLATVQSVAEEGQRMRHCVATLARAAVNGETFLFHVDSARGPATVQVNAQGYVVQARGPANADTAAAHDAAAFLNAWGRDFPGRRDKTVVVVDAVRGPVERALAAARAVGVGDAVRRFLRSTVNPDI